MTEVLRALGVAACMLAVMAAAEAWHRRSAPPVEWTRKLVHCGAGLSALAFPWLFHTVWPVLALGIVFAAFLRFTRSRGLLPSLHGVVRRSEGDLYYLAAVFLLFAIGRPWPIFYLVSLLVLILSDTLAAVLGTAYGKRSYAVEGGRRSAEGSVVFFLVTFLCVHLPLLLLTSLDRLAGVLIAVQVALLVTSLEAISLRGSDNLIVPLGTFYLLVKMTQYPAGWIAMLLGSELMILALVAVLAWRTRLLSTSGIIAAHLFFYGVWALRGPAWAIAPALALAGFMVAQRAAQKHPRDYQVLAVFYVTVVALALCFLDNTFDTILPAPAWLRSGQSLYAAYAGAFAAHLALVSGRNALRRVLPAFVWVVPAALWAVSSGVDAWLVAGGTCAGGILACALLRRLVRAQPRSVLELRLQSGGIALAALSAVLLHALLGVRA